MSAGKTGTYSNNVAPTARIYLHLICRKRHLPLKLRKGKTKGVRQKIQQRTNVWRGNHGFVGSLEPGKRKSRIRRCVNSPLKNLDERGVLVHYIM